MTRAKHTLETVGKTLVQMDGEVMMLDAGVKVCVTAEKQILHCII